MDAVTWECGNVVTRRKSVDLEIKSVANERKAAYNVWFLQQALISRRVRFRPVFPLSIETKGSFRESKVVSHKL
jgi:hypothetical protein